MIVIGDVHGEYKTLLSLLDILPQTQEICFIGDLIDRGPQSKEVVGLVRTKGWYSVLGNHEDMATDPSMVDTWIYNGGWHTIQSYCDKDEGFNYDTVDNFRNHDDIKWMHELPLTIQYKDFLISHSYCYNGDGTPNSDILWGRSFEDDCCTLINIFGHTPVKEAKKIHNKHWNIDTGCTFGGKLSAIDLDTEKIYSVNKVKDEV
jgi:serine/threonine protein phosphatase 1